ncbi:MAG: archease [Nanoarchaeota archaeon]
MNDKYEFLEHMADIKLKLNGNTLQDVFENVIFALAEYMSEGKKIESLKGKVIDVSGKDTSSLLYNFVDEILYLVDAEHFIPSKGSVLLRGNNLHAELYGDDTNKYTLKHIKAPTYAEMNIRKIKDKWTAQMVLDV